MNTNRHLTSRSTWLPNALRNPKPYLSATPYLSARSGHESPPAADQRERRGVAMSGPAFPSQPSHRISSPGPADANGCGARNSKAGQAGSEGKRWRRQSIATGTTWHRSATVSAPLRRLHNTAPVRSRSLKKARETNRRGDRSAREGAVREGADAPGGLDPLAPVEAEVERDPEPLRRVREGAVQRVAEAAHHVPGLGDERHRVGEHVAAVEPLLRQQRRDVEAAEGGVLAR